MKQTTIQTFYLRFTPSYCNAQLSIQRGQLCVKIIQKHANKCVADCIIVKKTCIIRELYSNVSANG